MNITVGSIVFLEPKSKHGKERIKQYGSIWRVCAAANNVFCKPGGLAYLLKSDDGDIRWISDRDDEDFTITTLGKYPT